MNSCGDCSFEANSAQGLSSHRRNKHSGGAVDSVPAGTPMVAAMRRTLVELERLGRFEAVDAARVQALMSMAESLDQNPFNSQMWRELRESLNEVTRADDDADDGLAAALAQIAGATSLGDPETS